MALVIEKPVAAFDMSKISRGYLLWARHSTWDVGKAGFVTSATESQLTVQYYPGIGNVTNHFHIPVLEAAAGEWEIRWSSDLSEVWEHGILGEEVDVPGETPEDVQDGMQEEGWDGLHGEGGLDELGRIGV